MFDPHEPLAGITKGEFLYINVLKAVLSNNGYTDELDGKQLLDLVERIAGEAQDRIDLKGRFT